MISKQQYREWAPVKLVDPRVATVEQLIQGMKLIVEAEGPILATRVFHIYANAGGLSRIYEPTRKRLIAALRIALSNKIVLSETEACEDPSTWILRLPDQAAVCVRGLGSRTLHEIPAAELAEVMLEHRVQNDLISKEELFRQVLAEYDLLRLTKATTERLEYVLKTWF